MPDIAQVKKTLMSTRGVSEMNCHPEERSELLLSRINSLDECRFSMEKNGRNWKEPLNKSLFFNLLRGLKPLPARQSRASIVTD